MIRRQNIHLVNRHSQLFLKSLPAKNNEEKHSTTASVETFLNVNLNGLSFLFNNAYTSVWRVHTEHVAFSLLFRPRFSLTKSTVKPRIKKKRKKNDHAVRPLSRQNKHMDTTGIRRCKNSIVPVFPAILFFSSISLPLLFFCCESNSSPAVIYVRKQL